MTYHVVLNSVAQKQFRRLDRQVQQQLKPHIQSLCHGLNHRCVKLKGYDDRYRLRSGSYRIVFEMHDGQLIVLLLSIAHRKDIYRVLGS
ncbi:MAG: type II toxin-antitoxin system RelE/ParE family toxin [Myxococcota bacterium]